LVISGTMSVIRTRFCTRFSHSAPCNLIAYAIPNNDSPALKRQTRPSGGSD
jgi:hypothetical protein